MTRIVAGRWGGRKLVTPDGDHTRPTGEKIRAALGNSLTATGALSGARVLDLFAGSGALGLELASRGADSVVLVDNDRAALTAARTNVQTLQAVGVEVVPADAATYASTALPRGNGRFDFVVADPPYTLPAEDIAAILLTLYHRELLAPGADLIVERPRRAGEFGWPDPLTEVKAKRYGDTLLCYGRAP